MTDPAFDNITVRLDKLLKEKDEKALQRTFVISLIIHLSLLFSIGLYATIRKPMKPPQKVYSVKILPAPKPVVKDIVEPEPEKKPEPKPEKKPEPEKPKVIEEKKPDKKPEPEPEPEKPQEPEPEPEIRKTFKNGEASIKIDGEPLEEDYYLTMILTKVSRHWRNPLMRSRTRVATTIYFRINKDGTISGESIEKRSGNTLFDNSALRAIRDAAPYGAIPESYTGDFLGIHFEFEHKP